MFSLVQLECFIAVAEELHFGAAATRMHMTQPPLSRQIQQLERALGVQLLDRTSRRVTLTEAGRVLLPNARRLIDLSAKTSADVQSVAAGQAGILTIAYTAMAGQSILPELVRRVSRELPGVSILLRELVSADQMDALDSGIVDVGLLRPLYDRAHISSQPLLEERFVLAVPAGSALAELPDPVFLRDLGDDALLMYSPGTARYLHDLLLTMLLASNVHPRISQYAGQISTLLALVSGGLGFTLVPASACRRAYPGVVFRAITDDDPSHSINRVRLEIAWNDESQNPLLAPVLLLAAELATADPENRNSTPSTDKVVDPEGLSR